MKRRIILSAVMCAFLATPVLAGPTVTTMGGAGYGIWQTGQGGEFTLKPSSDLSWVLSLYDASTTNQGGTTGTFQTFCVEEQEYIYPNTTFDVALNNKAVMGGTAGGDPISRGTAWLYHQFQNQTIDGYVWSGDGRHTSAQDLQNAIWFLEDEGGSLTAGYSAMLINQFSSIANAKLDNNGIPVKVLNLYVVGDHSQLRQDMLVCVPVPAAVLLGAVGFVALRRKLRRLVRVV
jgi:hypothetical protein